MAPSHKPSLDPHTRIFLETARGHMTLNTRQNICPYPPITYTNPSLRKRSARRTSYCDAGRDGKRHPFSNFGSDDGFGDDFGTTGNFPHKNALTRNRLHTEPIRTCCNAFVARVVTSEPVCLLIPFWQVVIINRHRTSKAVYAIRSTQDRRTHATRGSRIPERRLATHFDGIASSVCRK